MGKKTEDELFDIILDASRDAHDEIVLALESLISRNRIDHPQRALEVLLSAARNLGTSRPEGPMIARLMGYVIKRHPDLFERFLDILQNTQQTMFLIGFAAQFVKTVPFELKSQSIPALADLLFKQSSIDKPSDYIIDTLTSFEDNSLNEKVASRMIPELLGSNPLKVLFATRVLSKTAGLNASQQMLLVLRRSLDGWYDGHDGSVQDYVSIYLERCPDESALPLLRSLILVRFTLPQIQMFRSFRFASVADMLLEMIEENNTVNRQLADWCVVALAQIGPSAFDFKRLIAYDFLFTDNWNSRYYIKQMILSMKEAAKPILFNLLKDQDERKYQFARECLSEIGVTLDEMANEFPENPANELYRFFYPKDTIEEIWKGKGSREIGGSIGTPPRRFDLFVISLLSSFNFQVLYVDSANKPGVDIVALSPASNHMIIAGNTISSLKNDVNNLSATYQEMKETIGGLMRRFITYPVIFSASKSPTTPDESEFAKQLGIIVLDGDSIHALLTFSRTGRTSRHLIDFLHSNRQKAMGLPSSLPP